MKIYRDEVDSLRAENGRLRARVEELEATMESTKVKLEWRVGWGDVAWVTIVLLVICAAIWALFFIGRGIDAPVLRGAGCIIVAFCWWCVAFVRRVPR